MGDFFYIFQFKLLSNTKQSSIPVLCGSLQSPSNSYPTGKGAQAGWWPACFTVLTVTLSLKDMSSV